MTELARSPSSTAVAGIFRYPVKSMLGESLASCVLDASGVPGDRAYAVVDEESGAVASAKVPRRWGRLLEFSARYVAEPRPGAPVPPVEITFPDAAVRRSDDPDVHNALSAALGRRVRLAAEPPADAFFEEEWPEHEDLAPREFIDATAARRDDETGEVIGRIPLAALASPGRFYDMAVLHVLTEATLARLRELAPNATFDVRRFRPNLVLDVDGPAGFVENGWQGRTLVIGNGVRVPVGIPAMCSVMTMLAQGGLRRDVDAMRTVARHNRVAIPGMGTWACAGVYAEVDAGGEVRMGDAYEVR